MKKTSIGITIFFIALSIGVFCVAWTYPGESNGAMGPGFFPMIMAGIVFFLCVLLLYNTRKQKDEPSVLFSKANATVFLSLLIIVLYVGTIGLLGFPVATILFLIGLMKFFKIKSWKLPVLISVCTTGVVYCVFTMFLFVQLPRGIIF